MEDEELYWDDVYEDFYQFFHDEIEKSGIDWDLGFSNKSRAQMKPVWYDVNGGPILTIEYYTDGIKVIELRPYEENEDENENSRTYWIGLYTLDDGNDFQYLIDTYIDKKKSSSKYHYLEFDGIWYGEENEFDEKPISKKRALELIEGIKRDALAHVQNIAIEQKKYEEELERERQEEEENEDE